MINLLRVKKRVKVLSIFHKGDSTRETSQVFKSMEKGLSSIKKEISMRESLKMASLKEKEKSVTAMEILTKGNFDQDNSLGLESISPEREWK